MAIDALHDRLEYLVSYSSQLVLIGCESLAQQQSSLQRFLAIQHENTEIAFLNGEEGLTESDYRAEIYQQLTHQSDNAHAPLEQSLLPLLPQDSGPILICISAAEHVSTTLLNELWQLIQNNKKQKHNRHINVLLFGSPEWIAQAKLQLVNDTQHLPVLLSTETVEPISSTDNLLDTIRQNRRIVTHRLAKSEDEEEDQPLIAKPLFKYTIAAMFVGLFISIIYWQYPDEIRSFLDPQSTQKSQLVDSASPSLIPPQDDKVVDESIDDAKPERHSEDNIDLVKDDVDDYQLESSPNQDVIQSNNLEDDRQSDLDEQSLVTSWQREVEKIQSAEDEEPAAEPVQASEIESTAEAPATAAELNSAPEAAILASTENAENVDAAQSLINLSNDKFLLQITAMSDRQAIENFIAEHELTDNIWLYTTQRFGGDWHVVVHNQVFDSLSQARSFVSQLPSSIDSGQPFAKSAIQIKQELAITKE